MLSLAIAALFLAHLTAAAPLVVARAPASIQFQAPRTALATCSAPVTLSWSVTAPSDDDDSEKVKPKAKLASVAVVSASTGIARTLIEDPTTRSFTWTSVDVPPGQYIFTGAAADDDVAINPSEPFAVVAGDSLDCVPAAELAQVSTTSSTPSSTSSTSTSTPTSTAAASQTTPEAEHASTATVTSVPAKASSGVNGAVIAAIVVGVLILAAVAFGIYYRRVNRSRELVDVEYVYPPTGYPAGKDSRTSLEGRRSSETVVEVRARAPTPVGVLSRPPTKQQLASDLDPSQTQKMLRRL